MKRVWPKMKRVSEETYERRKAKEQKENILSERYRVKCRMCIADFLVYFYEDISKSWQDILDLPSIRGLVYAHVMDIFYPTPSILLDTHASALISWYKESMEFMKNYHVGAPRKHYIELYSHDIHVLSQVLHSFSTVMIKPCLL